MATHHYCVYRKDPKDLTLDAFRIGAQTSTAEIHQKLAEKLNVTPGSYNWMRVVAETKDAAIKSVPPRKLKPISPLVLSGLRRAAQAVFGREPAVQPQETVIAAYKRVCEQRFNRCLFLLLTFFSPLLFSLSSFSLSLSFSGLLFS